MLNIGRSRPPLSPKEACSALVGLLCFDHTSGLGHTGACRWNAWPHQWRSLPECAPGFGEARDYGATVASRAVVLAGAVCVTAECAGRSPGCWCHPFRHILAAGSSAEISRGFCESKLPAATTAGEMNAGQPGGAAWVPLQTPLRGPIPPGGESFIGTNYVERWHHMRFSGAGGWVWTRPGCVGR